MLRHDYSIYEDELYKLFWKVDKDIGYEILKEKVNREINKVYPYLK